ncbi:MAG: aminotransferase class IV [Candidatus Azobacteroides sp.]|nr:aminotransferase class IV [Candidatus Azobacteroides sp.]
MIRPVFSEVIKVKDGIYYNIPSHIERMNNTTNHFYAKKIEVNLSTEIIPVKLRTGLVKCRIEYSDVIHAIEFSSYSFRNIQKVGFVRNDHIDYSFKYIDRTPLNEMLMQSRCDEIIIVKNGLVTDASSSNLVFENETGMYTPSSYLLPGRKRKLLLQQKKIKERLISMQDIEKYKTVHFINTMIDLEDHISFPVDLIEKNRLPVP